MFFAIFAFMIHLRERYLERIESGLKVVPIVMLIGARQVGKTTLMQSFRYQGSTLFLNGQDPDVSALFEKLPDLEQYLRIYLDKDLTGLLLLDELQYIPDVSRVLKLLTDKHTNIRVLCSGSSSMDILQSVEESLAGRLRMIEVFSLSFTEYLDFRDTKLHALFTAMDSENSGAGLIEPFDTILHDYLLYGGLPRSALLDDPNEKLAVLNDIYKTYLLHDVRSYIKNEHFTGFNKLLRLLAAQNGNLVNVNELSRESGLPYKMTAEYLALLEHMYIIKLVEPWHTNRRSVITKMKKIYFCDTGILNILLPDFRDPEFRSDGGALLENFVFLELLRNLNPGGEIRFYRTTDGSEVDFVVNQPKKMFAVECKYKTMDRPMHSRALSAFSSLGNVSERYIVNRNLNTTDQEIRFIPAVLVPKIR